eukprot:NODE_1744_length_1393_cov_28.575829_g1656_i0.p1 GENE.NODE_1744_length_1393_cov_28.575829_g1656_i0~~NODE_1744_length_1393_cov_28.575829_g1656_i0.p1  ORF type:complete len:429 (+),score=56.39 NODE_1744_length_1393_cov_28.575829_g1656_i0:3-1289(+)
MKPKTGVLCLVLVTILFFVAILQFSTTAPPTEIETPDPSSVKPPEGLSPLIEISPTGPTPQSPHSTHSPPVTPPLNAPETPRETTKFVIPDECAEGCSLNGECVNKECRCDRGWTGPVCGRLILGAVAETEGYRPEGASSWGGSLIFANNTYYLFHTTLTNTSIRNWEKSSGMALATSDRPTGPYKWHSWVRRPVQDQSFDGTTVRDPAVVWHQDRYLLYYVGLNCIVNEEECAQYASIGLLSSSNPLGPWHSHGPILTPQGSGWEANALFNPSVIVDVDGSMLLYYRGDDTNFNGVGVARAHSFEGPYVRENGGVAIFGKRPHIRQVDPFVWRDPRGYHMLLSATNIARKSTGGLAYSADGIRWRAVVMRPAFTHELHFHQKGRLAFKQRMRPSFLLSNNTPTHLITTVEELKGYRTWTSIVPIGDA